MRTTGVKLIADLVQYKREMREGAKATRGLKDEIDETVTTSDKLGEQLGDSAKKGARELEDVRKAAANLDKQIADTDRGVRELAKGFAQTGDTGVLKAFNEQKRVLSQLKKVRSLLPDADELADAGADMGKSLIGGIRSSLAGASPASLGIGVAAAAAAAPVIGAAVSAAVIGGASVGGVIGGLMLVKDDPRIEAAGKDLADNLLGTLKRDAAPFVEPVLQAVDKIEDRFGQMNGRIQNIFDKSSGFLSPLLNGALDGVDGLLKGVEDLVTEGKPVIDAFGESFQILGDATGDALSTISGGSEDAASAITVLAKTIGAGIQATGYLVRALTEVYGVITYLPGKFQDLEYAVGRYLGIQMAAGPAVKDSAVEIYNQAAALIKSNSATAAATEATRVYVATQADVKNVQTELTGVQQAYSRTLASLGGSATFATKAAEGLRQAQENIYGAAIAGTEANEAYQASWDDLSGAISANGRSLDIHTSAGRANRDALQSLLLKSNDLYFADINAGVAVDKARSAHEKRTKAVEKEADKLGLNKKATQDLIGTYGKIPAKKETDLVLDGVRSVVNALEKLYIYQRSLATGKSIASVEQTLRRGNDNGPAKAGGGYHTGGYTGDGGKYDEAGTVHRKEFVLRSEATTQIRRNHPGFLEEANATGQLPGYAKGGLVAPVDTSKVWPFPTDVSGTRIPSRSEVASKVIPSFGAWPSSPSAQRGDSGVWRAIVALIRGTGPMSGSFGNAYRPGDPLWHGSGRAVDWMGYNQDGLARFLAARRPLELIHRTNKRDYAYTRGVNKGSFNEALMNAHRNHIHIAMKNGGLIQEPVLGVGESGATYSFGEGGIHERVIPMNSGGGGGSMTIVLQNHGVIASPMEAEAWLSAGIDNLRRKGKF